MKDIKIHRKNALLAGGVSLSLPFLESVASSGAKAKKTPMRMLIMMNSMGLYPKAFWPKKPGENYILSETLSPLKDVKHQFTVFNGLSHPGTDGGHLAEECFCNAAKHPGTNHFRHSISIDQFAAQQIGTETRYASLSLSNGGNSLSFTQNGVKLPSIRKASDLYKKLFIQGSPKEIERQVARLEKRGSILDVLMRDYKLMSNNVSKQDKDRLDQYFTSIRDVEKNLAHKKAWSKKEKPQLGQEIPKDERDLLEFIKTMSKVSRLAFETDSTRMINFMCKVDNYHGWHGKTHHGQNTGKLKQLKAIDKKFMEIYRDMITDYAGIQEGDGSLLDHTMIMHGSNLGDANVHNNKNLPIILAGGGFKHGSYLDYNHHEQNTPLCNLFLTMLHKMGVKADKFASSSGALKDFS